MKTRKTLKKRGTSKKYNKTQFRRYNKHNNLTSKMKGGGWFRNIILSTPTKKTATNVFHTPTTSDMIINNYSDWIEDVEQLKTDIENAKTYGWLEAPAMKINRLLVVNEALRAFKQNEESGYEDMLTELIKMYDERRQDNGVYKSINLKQANDLLSRLHKDMYGYDWLKKYIEHLNSVNNGLTKSEKKSVDKELQKIDAEVKQAAQLEEEINWLLLKVEQDATIAEDVMKINKEEIIQKLKNIIESKDFLENRKYLESLMIKYKSKSIDNLKEDIKRLITAVENNASIAMAEMKKSKEEVLGWLNELSQILDWEEWPSGSDQSMLLKLEELYNLSFLDRLKQFSARVLSPLPSSPQPRIGTRHNLPAVPKFNLPRHAATMEQVQTKFNNDTPKNGGINKRTVKRNVKSKKRRR